MNLHVKEGKWSLKAEEQEQINLRKEYLEAFVPVCVIISKE